MIYRNKAIHVLKACNVEDAELKEQEVFDNYGSKYALIIRRLATGMSMTEATTELEPIEETKEEVMVEGTITCPKCKSKKIHRVEKQTRSADESATVFCYCSDCGKRWRMS